MTTQKHIRELAGRHVEVLRALELLQQALTATTNASMMMAEQSAEAYHSIQEAADALRAATLVVRHCNRSDARDADR